MSWPHYLLLFLIGFLGSGHCVGMCGGFAMLLGQAGNSRSKLLLRYSLYQLGKALTYMFLGGLVSMAGGAFGGSVGFERLQTALAIVAGIFMIVFGFGLLTDWKIKGPNLVNNKLAKTCSPILQLLQMRSAGSAFLLGWFNGFLPCGLVWVALGYIASLTSLADGLIGAFFFGLGTYPSLLILAFTHRQFTHQKRKWLLRFAGGALILFGIITALRWHPVVHHWFHRGLVIEALSTIIQANAVLGLG